MNPKGYLTKITEWLVTEIDCISATPIAASALATQYANGIANALPQITQTMLNPENCNYLRLKDDTLPIAPNTCAAQGSRVAVQWICDDSNSIHQRVCFYFNFFLFFCFFCFFAFFVLFLCKRRQNICKNKKKNKNKNMKKKNKRVIF